MIFKFVARIILLPFAILILEINYVDIHLPIFSDLFHPRVQGSLTEQLFESWESLSGFHTAIRQHCFPKTLPTKLFDRSSPTVRSSGSPIFRGQDLLLQGGDVEDASIVLLAASRHFCTNYRRLLEPRP